MSPKILLQERKIYGWSEALHRFYHRRHLPVLAYIVLALAVCYSLNLEHNHANELNRQTRTVLVSGCERQNVLRLTLRHLVLKGIPTTRQYVKEGTLTPEQGRRAERQTRDAAAKLKPTDCKKAFPKQ